jgi:hypothetical protein
MMGGGFAMSAVCVPWSASRKQTKRRRPDVRSAATPLRRGRRIMVRQTRVLMDDGTLTVVAIQTQMVLRTWPGISATPQAQPAPLP